MQVSNHPITNQTLATEQTLDLKQGEIHRATIKERVSDNLEAPRNSPTQQQTDVDQVLRNVGAGSNPSPGLREAAKVLIDRGIPLTKEIIQELRTFFEREKGTIQQKLETIEALLNRRLPITQSFLRPVHEALHGRALPETLSELSKYITAQLGKQFSEGKLSQEARQALANELVDRIMQRLSNTQAPGQESRPQEVSTSSTSTANQQSAVIKGAIQQVQREANFTRVIEQIRMQVTNHPALSREIATQLERALSEAASLQQQGRELAARGHLVQALTRVEEQVQVEGRGVELRQGEQIALAQATSASGEQAQTSYLQNEQFQTSQVLHTKDFIVSKVTQKLAEATQAFTDLKRDVSRGLDQVTRLVQQLRHQAIPQAKQMLSTTIDKLDKAILKSELTMLTDMKTEKQLMQASSLLAQAKRLLSKGDFSGAQNTVQNVKNMLDKLRWQPSETRVQHYVLKEMNQLEQQRPSISLLTQVEQNVRPLLHQEPSARTMFENLRALGLNHDSETARSLALTQESTQQDTGSRHGNTKAVLLQLLRAEAEQGRMQQQAEQALHNLTGQQLLSKSDPGNPLQQLLLNIPFELEDNLQNLRVMINGRKEGEKLDWENCSIYFLIETQKLGEVGILLSATERNLSITIKNDSPDFREKMEPLVEQCKENLKEVGYQVTGIHFAKLETKHAVSQEQRQSAIEQSNIEPNKLSPAQVTAKGFDLKI